jgi:glycolate dehydrogenase iron-sulfur subunit
MSTTAKDGPRGIEWLLAQEEQLLACVHCGFCLSVCPTYTRLGDEADSPRGRLYLMRAAMEGRIPPDVEAFATHIDRCLGCRACETVCPAGVEYGRLLEAARATIVDARGESAVSRALLAVFRSATLSGVFYWVGRVARDIGVARLLLRLLPRRLARARLALAMLAASRPRGAPKAAATRPSRPQVTRARVAMLTGCVQRGLFSRVNRATVDALQANGCDIVGSPGQGCCGALHAHAGELRTAQQLARDNVDAFSSAGVEAVIVNAAGCAAMMKEYGRLLADDAAYAERARVVAAKVRDVFEFLDVIGTRPGGAVPMRVAYDAPCHLYHAQGIRDAPLRVLAAVPELEVVLLARFDECCGGAGIYGLLHPRLAGRILGDKVEDILKCDPAAVVTGNPGCIMQIGAGLLLAGDQRPVLHPVELLADSYRRATTGPSEREAE